MLERGKELLVQIRSMRVQLFAVLVVIGLIPVIFFSNILINSYEKRLISQRTDEIQSMEPSSVTLLTVLNILPDRRHLKLNRKRNLLQPSIRGVF